MMARLVTLDRENSEIKPNSDTRQSEVCIKVNEGQQTA